MTFCVCGSGKEAMRCCILYISGKQLPPDPKSLLRSRYIAYMTGNMSYIAATMHGIALAKFNVAKEQRWAQEIEWLQLEILQVSPISAREVKGSIEFKVHYLDQNGKQILHEVGEYEYINGRWYHMQATEIRSKS